MSDVLLPSGVDVAFADIESTLLRDSGDAGKASAMALTATVVVAGPAERLVEAAEAVASLKDVPTMQELGVKDFNVSIFHGLYAPKGTPAPVLKKLNDALKAALKDPEFVKREEGLGAVVVNDKRTDPAEHKKFVQAEINKWSPLIKAANVYVE